MERIPFKRTTIKIGESRKTLYVEEDIHFEVTVYLESVGVTFSEWVREKEEELLEELEAKP